MTEGFPHQFVEVTIVDKIKRRDEFGDEVEIVQRRMRCRHCKKEFTTNHEAQPIGTCPARDDKREIDRITRRPPSR